MLRSSKLWIIVLSSIALIFLFQNCGKQSNRREMFSSFGVRPFKLASGGNHNCALYSDGSVKCWGYNGSSQLGDGGFEDSIYPKTVAGVTEAIDITGAQDWTCVVIADGSVKCWGDAIILNPDQESQAPTTILGLSNVTKITGHHYFACALISNGTVKCWGHNEYGELGIPTTTGWSSPVTVAGLTNVVDVSAGGHHVCALLQNQTVKCWGHYSAGSPDDRYTPALVNGLSQVAQISAGLYETCARLVDGKLKCWNQESPRLIPTAPIKEVALGVAGCVRYLDDSVACWGNNVHGQLGDGTFLSRDPPLSPVVGLGPAQALFLSTEYSRALVGAGFKCWGNDDFSQLGNQYDYRVAIPTAVADLDSVEQLSIGDQHQCALLSDQTVKCWGSNFYSQVGDPNPTTFVAKPQKVEGLAGVVEISAGENHTCARLNDSSVKCWGIGTRGELGSNISSTPNPTEVPIPHNVTQINSNRMRRTCALTSDQTVTCWGNIPEPSFPVSSAPTDMGLSGVSNFSTGHGYNCYAFNDTSTKCRGDSPFVLLTNIPDAPNALSLSQGSGFSCARFAGSSVKCWGENNKGQLGTGNTETHGNTSARPTLGTYTHISAGYEHACGVTTMGKVECWGGNDFRQVGNGNFIHTPNPTEVYNIHGATKVAAGESKTCAILSDKTVKCWGKYADDKHRKPLPVDVRL